MFIVKRAIPGQLLHDVALSRRDPSTPENPWKPGNNRHFDPGSRSPILSRDGHPYWHDRCRLAPLSTGHTLDSESPTNSFPGNFRPRCADWSTSWAFKRSSLSHGPATPYSTLTGHAARLSQTPTIQPQWPGLQVSRSRSPGRVDQCAQTHRTRVTPSPHDAVHCVVSGGPPLAG